MKTLAICLILILGASCGGKKSSKSSKPEVKVDPYHERPLELTQKEEVSFHRKEQMVSRYKCDGTIKTRELETQNSLSKKITIQYENRKKAWSYSVYNRRNKDSKAGIFTENGNFVIDYAPTVFNMRVKQGINDIEYVFKRCTQISTVDGRKVCTGVEELEIEGMVQINVTYSSEVLPGEQHLRPDPASCTKP